VWDRALSSRTTSHLLVGALVLALALLAGMLTLGPGAGESPAPRLLDRARAGSSPARAGLAANRPAHVERRHVAARRTVPPARGDAGAAEPQPTAAAGQLVAAVRPASPTATKPPGSQEPEHAPSPDPSPPPPPNSPSPPPPAPVPAPPPDPSPPPEPQPAPQPPSPPADDGEVLVWATFESGDFGGWYVQSLPERVSTSSTEPFEGAQAARFEVQDGDVEPDTGSERSEISGPTFDEGEDLYIRDAIRVPGESTYEGPWQIIQQLHEKSWGGSPGIAVFLNSQPALQLGAGDGSPTYWRSGPLEVDRWYDLVYRVYLSQDPSEGFVEVWLDGVQQTLLNGQTRAYGQTIQTSQTYIKVGIYRSRSSTGTSLVEHDAVVIGTGLGAVSAG